tara:strand:+ start:154 stop:303 length:150 start_codon:yes stop_codon:yes gene_type:complete
MARAARRQPLADRDAPAIAPQTIELDTSLLDPVYPSWVLLTGGVGKAKI